MYQNDTEILFPMRVALHLRDLRGEAWRRLVEGVTSEPEASLNQLAFSLLMIRLNSCLTCHTDCYRAMRGCTACAIQVVRRYRGDDQELVALFRRARDEVSRYLRRKRGVQKERLTEEREIVYG